MPRKTQPTKPSDSPDPDTAGAAADETNPKNAHKRPFLPKPGERKPTPVQKLEACRAELLKAAANIASNNVPIQHQIHACEHTLKMAGTMLRILQRLGGTRA